MKQRTNEHGRARTIGVERHDAARALDPATSQYDAHRHVAMAANPMLGSICFFNNKGGVGKTTLACNVASCLSLINGLRVLIVDADPQCNATQLILPEGTTERLYVTEAAEFHTLKDVLGPLMAGDASLRESIVVAGPDTNRFGVSVLAGHPKIALLEDHLSTNWGSFLGGNLGGARVSNWNTQLLRILWARDEFDLIIFDVGPSLGALNRSILIGVDYFLAPMGCDIFSLIGIANIADWIERWRKSYDQSYTRCLENHAAELNQYDVRPSADPMSRFIGYTVQQYITSSRPKTPSAGVDAPRASWRCRAGWYCVHVRTA